MFEKSWFESWYATKDPWSYRSISDDINRKNILLKTIAECGPHDKVLDIGCGEGFITESIDSHEVHGIEISDSAASRFAPHIKRVHSPEAPYSLTLTAGTLYKEYDHVSIARWVVQSKSRWVLVAGIKDWLIPYNFGNIINQFEFDYRGNLRQQVTLYETSA